jgi:hypothetical protein
MGWSFGITFDLEVLHACISLCHSVITFVCSGLALLAVVLCKTRLDCNFFLQYSGWPRTMSSGCEQECIVSISPWDSFKIHFLSFICGFWVILKRLPQWAWNRNGFFSLQRREAPPPCLVDSELGRHSYMKLKVSSCICIISTIKLCKYTRNYLLTTNAGVFFCARGCSIWTKLVI